MRTYDSSTVTNNPQGWGHEEQKADKKRFKGAGERRQSERWEDVEISQKKVRKETMAEKSQLLAVMSPVYRFKRLHASDFHSMTYNDTRNLISL